MTRIHSTNISTTDLIEHVEQTKARLVLALPSLPKGLGRALLDAHERLHGRVLVVVDPDERVYRLGFGSLDEVESIHGTVPLARRAGLRLGCILTDDVGIFIMLQPELVEAPPEPEADPINAILVEPLSAISYLRAIANCPELGNVLEPHPDIAPSALEDPVDRIRHNAEAEETPIIEPMRIEEIEGPKRSLEIAPPLDFQVHRQSMVYSSLLLYVEIELTGCRLVDRGLTVPQNLLPLLGSKADQTARHNFPLHPDLQQDGLEVIRQRKQTLATKLARNLGKPYGTVLLRKHERQFWSEVESIRSAIAASHPQAIAAFKKGLGAKLEDIAEVCVKQSKATMNELAIIKALNPGKRDPEAYRAWESWANSSPSSLEVDRALRDRVMEALDANLDKMLDQLSLPRLEVMVREFTFQQMNHDDFKAKLLAAFSDEPELAPFLESKAVIGLVHPNQA